MSFEQEWERARTPVMNSEDYHEIKGLQGQIVQFSLGYNNNLFIVDEDGCKWEFFNVNNQVPLIESGASLYELQDVTLNRAFYSFGCAVGEGCWTTIDFTTSGGEFSIEYQDRASYTYSEGE